MATCSTSSTQCEGLANTLARLAKGATSQRMVLQAKTGRAGQQGPDSELVVQLELAHHTQARAGVVQNGQFMGYTKLARTVPTKGSHVSRVTRI